ncbi:MAG: DUF4197 domain-containing protein [Candidatus Kapaibacteriota bacterium]
MKHSRKLPLLMIFVVFGLTTQVSQAQLFESLKNKAKGILQGDKQAGGFTEQEAVSALKEALQNGITKGTETLSKPDGYFGNQLIRIPFPQEAKQIESSLRKIGMGKTVDDAVLSLNRAAEDAATKALPIFVDAIKGMTFQDAIGIVKGDSIAGTRFLQKTTTNALTAAFRPVIEGSLDKVDATKHWSTVMNAYNKIPFVQRINPDLTQYVTEKALEGLFFTIANEEKSIRKDPLGQASALLRKVFGWRP